MSMGVVGWCRRKCQHVSWSTMLSHNDSGILKRESGYMTLESCIFLSESLTKNVSSKIFLQICVCMVMHLYRCRKPGSSWHKPNAGMTLFVKHDRIHTMKSNKVSMGRSHLVLAAWCLRLWRSGVGISLVNFCWHQQHPQCRTASAETVALRVCGRNCARCNQDRI